MGTRRSPSPFRNVCKMHHNKSHFSLVGTRACRSVVVRGLAVALAVSFFSGCGSPLRASEPPSMPSASAHSRAADAALARRFHDVRIAVDVSGEPEESSIMDVGKHIARCSAEERRCFVTLRLLRPLAGIQLLRTGVVDAGARSEFQHLAMGSGAIHELIREGKPTSSAPLTQACLESRSTCELPVDVGDLESAQGGAIVMVDVFTSPLPEEVAAKDREERARRAAEERACQDACVNDGMCALDCENGAGKGDPVWGGVQGAPKNR